MKHSIAEFNRSGTSQKWSEILNIKWLKIKRRKGNGLKKKKSLGDRWEYKNDLACVLLDS